MHEMSLALEIRSICERELAQLPESRLTAVGIEVGAFSGVEVESLRFCLEVVLADGHEGVRCELFQQPGQAACPSCGSDFEVRVAPFQCPDCGGLARGASGGRGLQLRYLEVE